jgi:hypothetical protein
VENGENVHVHKMLQQVYGEKFGVPSRTHVAVGREGRVNVTSEDTLDRPKTSE